MQHGTSRRRALLPAGFVALGLLFLGAAPAAAQSVVATGSNEYGQCNVSEWSGVSAIAAGSYHTVGLRSDGTVVATGRDISGECRVSEWSGIVAIAAGSDYTLGLKRDGTVVQVGFLGTMPADWTGIQAIASSPDHVVGLKGDGTVVASGNNWYDRCSVSTWSGITAIAAGRYHTVGLRSDGTVIATGYMSSLLSDWSDLVTIGAAGYCTLGLKADGTAVVEGGWALRDWSGVFAVAGGDNHLVALKRDGTVVAAGNDSAGQCQVSGWTGISAITAGGEHTVGLRAGTAATTLRFLSQPTDVPVSQPMLPPVRVALVDAAGNPVPSASGTVVLSLKANPTGAPLSGTRVKVVTNGIALFDDLKVDRPGSGYTLAARATGLAGTTSAAFAVSAAPTRVAFTVQPSPSSVGRVMAPVVEVSLLDASGRVATGARNAVTLGLAVGPAGASLSGTLTATAFGGVARFADLELSKAGIYRLRAEAAGLSAASSTAFAITVGPCVVAVGANGYGQCNVSDWSEITAISAGDTHTVGLRRDGTVVAVGDNGVRECDVSDWRGMACVVAGWMHTIGLKSDGTVVTVGNDAYGECRLSGWSGIIALATGAHHSVGLQSNGTVVAQGLRESGACNVGGWRDIVAIAAGAFHTVGLRRDGTVAATGANGDHQCDVSAWSRIVAIAAGKHHTVGLRSDGTVVATGDNDEGQCDVSAWHDIVAVAAGDAHTVGLRSDGTVVAVGYEENGQCDVSGWRGITAISAGGGHTVGLMAPAAQLSFSLQPARAVALQPIRPGVKVVVLDPFGNPVDTNRNAVMVTLSLGTNPGRAMLSGTLTAPAVNGVATFTDVKIDKAGAGYRLIATSPGLVRASSAAFNVTGTPARLAFTVLPATATAGAALSPAPKVSLLDAAGNVVTGATNPVTLIVAAGPAGATLSGATTVKAVGGVATFGGLKPNKAGTYYLRATAAGLSGATSGAFSVAAGPAKKMAFSRQPTNAAAGAALPAVQVRVQDAFGNACPTAANAVTLALSMNPTGAVLAGSKTVSAARGVATFTRLSIPNPGTGYVLRATASGLNTTMSTPFDVTAAPPAQPASIVQPGEALPVP